MEHHLVRLRGWAIAAGVLLGCVAFAGIAMASPVHVGALGGIGFSKFRGPSSPVVDFAEVKSACYGAMLRFPVVGTFSVEVEALAVTDGISYGKGQHTDDSGNVIGTFEDLHVVDWLQVPVVLRFMPPSPVRLQPFVFAGPYASTRLREYERLTGSISSTTTDELLKSSDFGITAGGGAQGRLGPGALELQARYDTGLTDLGNLRGLGAARTGALRLLAGYSF